MNEQNTQELILWKDENERNIIVSRLEEAGFRFAGGESPAPNAIAGFCVDLRKKVFFRTNAACAAARAQAGKKCLMASDLDRLTAKQ